MKCIPRLNRVVAANTLQGGRYIIMARLCFCSTSIVFIMKSSTPKSLMIVGHCNDVGLKFIYASVFSNNKDIR